MADTESEATYQELFRSLKPAGSKVSNSSSQTTTTVSKRPSAATSRELLTRGLRSTTVETFSAWSEQPRRKKLASDLRAIFAAQDGRWGWPLR